MASSSFLPSPPSSASQQQQQNSISTTSPANERRDPFRSLIKPFLKRGSSNTLDSIRDHLKLNKPSLPPPTSSPPRLTSSGSSTSKKTRSLENQPQNHARQKISRARQAATLKLHALSTLSSSRQPTSTRTSTASTSPRTQTSSFPGLSNHSHHHPSRNQLHDSILTQSHPVSSLASSSARHPNSVVSVTSSIHSLLTQPALVTLAQLAPAQLLSGVHSSCFGSSDAFRVFDDYELSQRNQHYRSLNELSEDDLTLKLSNIHQNAASHPSPRHLPTTIEQLSASSIALPITSISSIWRLLNCIEWINLKEHQLITDDRNLKISSHSYSTHSPCLTPNSSQQQGQQQQRQQPESQENDHHLQHCQESQDTPPHSLGSFDLANTLQHVGDILSAISSESDVEIVFYHIFYPARTEAAELELLNAAREQDQSTDHHFSFSSESGPTRNPTEQSNDRINIDPSPETPNPFLGAGADGEGGLREISVKADEKGLIIGLTCLLRQILYRAKRSSTIEVGLHLTPLHSQAPSQPQEDGDNREPAPGGAHQGDSFSQDGSVCTSWKCVFDVSLMAPLLPTCTSPQSIVDNLLDPTLPSDALHGTNDPSNPGPDPDRRTSIGAQLRASATLARLQMSSNLTSELPLCPEESLSKIIFEKLLGMKLSTGRLTSSGHSWKVTGIFGKGVGRESDEADTASRKSHLGHTQPSVSAPASVLPSREPTADELTKFAETALKGKKAVFFAAEQSIFAKHITTYLTSWNIDVSHMPYEESGHDSSNVAAHQAAAEASSGVGAGGAEKASAAQSGSTMPPNSASSRSIRSNHFIIIDDDLTTLKAQLIKLKASPASLLHLSATALSNQPSQRPLMSRRLKSTTQIDRFEGLTKQIHTSVIHFTSISNFRKVQDIIRNHLTGVQWVSIPDILVIPKPIGPRRILTALHTALSRPITEPQFVPIATSPSSPGTPHYLSSTSHPLGSSQLSKASPANYLGVADFDTAAENHLKNEANLGNENPSLARVPSIQNMTPPGLRTPGTAPGTPGVPSPALLSNEALEYFSKAATENGGSSSTGVVLQSPDGRPQAMFFHHSGSSNRLRNELFTHSIHGAIQSSHMGGSGSGKLKFEGRSSSSRPMLREMISADPSNTEPMTLAQQVMASAECTARTQSPSSYSNAGSNDPTKSDASTLSNHQNPLGQSIRNNTLTGSQILGDPPDSPYPRAMALASYEAISPRTPSLPFPEGLYAAHQQRQNSGSLSSHSVPPTPTSGTAPVTPNTTQQNGLSPLTKEQQQVLLNPRPLPLLRMPSISANLPTSISVTLPSPRRLPVSLFPTTNNPNSESNSNNKSRSPQNSPPIPTHRSSRPTLDGPASHSLNTASSASNNHNPKPSPSVNELSSAALAQSTSALTIAANRRRASMGDSLFANRLGRRRVSRKPTTALVPPINVLIVEDNRINQTILTTFMRKKNVRFDVAMNGQEAVDKWRTGSFHLVLMDLQLPVKDGIEATKEIREAERSVNINAFANTPPAIAGNTPPALVVPNTSCRLTPHNVSVIIVALTASSLDVDREVALAAGCNDFLTKPVSLAWLEKKLLEWGSMAWLSGFSRPNISGNSPLNRSLPASASTGFHPPGGIGAGPSTGNESGYHIGADGNRSIMSFTGTLAQKKAQEVAEHLHLSSDKARGTQMREKAAALVPIPRASSLVRESSLENSSDLSSTDDDGGGAGKQDQLTTTGDQSTEPKVVDQPQKEQPSSPSNSTPDDLPPLQAGQIVNNSSSTIPNCENSEEILAEEAESSPNRPTISLQTPTPERFDSFPTIGLPHSSSIASSDYYDHQPRSVLDRKARDHVNQVLILVNNHDGSVHVDQPDHLHSSPSSRQPPEILSSLDQSSSSPPTPTHDLPSPQDQELSSSHNHPTQIFVQPSTPTISDNSSTNNT
ncbi:hypothetical protein MJO28_015052 [Puccinia striiformis f. sp. tritici]|uniref:Uncharacterized protein n=1 Tax=Puccinia striiformis f. sp. tritici TaxID=168172 RepID=A0ACC0DRU6_9BASI|nr:hypothetical protein MJO28_015052 [Puccinia striiformis f. sp. tritici]